MLRTWIARSSALASSRETAGALLLAMLLAAPCSAASLAERIEADARAGRPLVVHVFVALCDNEHQGIVPVPRHLGDGQDPGTNLYWGARYGVRTYFARDAGWSKLAASGSLASGVLERAVFSRAVRGTRVFLVAEAWDGERIREALTAFLEAASGRGAVAVEVDGLRLAAGGASHVVAFVGHNGFMDFAPPTLEPGAQVPERGAMVLACASRNYFTDVLRRSRAVPLLLTTGLMAPEAYSLEAAVRVFFETLSPTEMHSAVAARYDAFQHCGLRGAQRLFAVPSTR